MEERYLSKEKTDILSLVYRPQLLALERVVEEMGYPSCIYSLFNPAEGKYCILMNGVVWSVCSFERGYRHGEQLFDTLQDTCISLVLRMSRSPKEGEIYAEKYLSYVREISTKEAPAECVQRLLLDTRTDVV